MGNGYPNTIPNILFIFYYSFAWVMIIINCFFFFKVITKVRREVNHASDLDLVQKVTSKLKWYPIIQIICLIPGTINRTYDMLTDEQSFELTLIQAIFDYLSGFLFAIVYGLNPSLKNAIYKCIRFCCCKKTRTSFLSEDLNVSKDSFKTRSLTVNNRTFTSNDISSEGIK